MHGLADALPVVDRVAGVKVPAVQLCSLEESAFLSNWHLGSLRAALAALVFAVEGAGVPVADVAVAAYDSVLSSVYVGYAYGLHELSLL